MTHKGWCIVKPQHDDDLTWTDLIGKKYHFQVNLSSRVWYHFVNFIDLMKLKYQNWFLNLSKFIASLIDFQCWIKLHSLPVKTMTSCTNIFPHYRPFEGSAYIFRGGKSVKIVLPPFWSSVYSKRKEFAPLESDKTVWVLADQGIIACKHDKRTFIWHCAICGW